MKTSWAAASLLRATQSSLPQSGQTHVHGGTQSWPEGLASLDPLSTPTQGSALHSPSKF